ncbi:hypothetical protein [Mycobacterium sp. 94-17]|nr:hypothetical protein [Mycobacterium sp. 94-17]MEB4208044.1 hypothetical protein [Mycobacterium sp. 94-17]
MSIGHIFGRAALRRRTPIKVESDLLWRLGDLFTGDRLVHH